MRLTVTFIVLCALCVVYGLFVEPRRLLLTEIEVGSGDNALIVAHISDVHIGGFHMDLTRLQTVINKATVQNPDLIILTGDYVSGHEPRQNRTADFNQTVVDGVAMLGQLSASNGVYAVLGNHDNWYDGPFIKQSLTASGIVVLNNESEINSNGICIVGLADHDTDKEDDRAFDGCELSPIIAAMHSPDSFAFMPSGVALGLAGHTHGGQVNLPLLGRRVTATSLGQAYAYGLKNWQGVPVYINAGLGTSILPVRFRAPPEIALITLRY